MKITDADRSYVKVDVSEGTAWVTLSEPRRLNPVHTARILALTEACAEVSAREDVRVVVVTGAGRGFCSGADRDRGLQLEDRRPPGAGSIRLAPGLWTLTSLRQPVIAMVNGPAVGYGAELALQADFRIAGESATFQFPFSSLGVVSDTGAGTWLLPRLVGWSRAAEILYLGETLTAAYAKEIGLVNRVVPDDQLRDEVSAFATRLCERSALSLMQLKAMIFAGLEETKGEHVLNQYLRFAIYDAEVDTESYGSRDRQQSPS